MTGFGARMVAPLVRLLFRVRMVRWLLLAGLVLLVAASLDLPFSPGPLVDVLLLVALVGWVLRRVRGRRPGAPLPPPAESRPRVHDGHV